MDRWKKFPWRRLLALLAVAVALFFAISPVQGEKMYVKVGSSSADAVVVSSTDFFEQEPLGRLIQNQPVEMLDKTDGEYVKIKAKIDGKDVEGWVKKVILQKKPLENVPRVSESGAVDNASFAAPGFNKEIEDGMRKDSDEMAAALKRVDNFEEKRAKLMGLDPKAENPDPTPQMKHYRDFAKSGGLSN
ncbi:MAG: hypothetical protein H6839_02210 [Planctomycetes bacterium]|nr:hypothetical protein [Planctomycetota bacterium]